MKKTIGIDKGHCESSAAIPCQSGANGKYEVKRLVTRNKEQVIPTQVYLTKEQMSRLKGHKRPSYELLSKFGEIKIGNEVPADSETGEVFRYFKCVPKEFDELCGNTDWAEEYQITHGQVMACFIYAYLCNILEQNTGELTKNDRSALELLVGCPTTEDWTSAKAQKAYAELIQTATGVQSVRIIPESRAALFSSIENGKNRISAAKGVLVFDFGSSTADCTYMLLGRKIIEFSSRLGAYEIERQMTKEAYCGARQENGEFIPTKTSFAFNENELRRVKERYYSREISSKGVRISCDFEKEDDDSLVEHSIRVNQEFMEKVTGENKMGVLFDSKMLMNGSWQYLCKKFMEDAKKRVSEATYISLDSFGKEVVQNCEIDTIVLTGGASRMDFIMDICKSVFPETKIYLETNPSHTVSNGLGWIAISDDNFQNCLEAAKKEVKGKEDCGVYALKKRVSDKLFNYLLNVIETYAKKWADTPGNDLTARHLMDQIEQYLSGPKGDKEIKEICKNEIEAWKKQFSDAMEQSVNHQVSKLYTENVARNIIIPKDVWRQLQDETMKVNNFNVEQLIKNLDMRSGLVKIAKTVTYLVILGATTILGGLAITFGGPLFGSIITFILGIIGGTIAELVFTDEDLDKKRKKRVREYVAKHIKEDMIKEKGLIMESFNENFEKQTEGYEALVDETLTKAFEIVTLRRFEI